MKEANYVDRRKFPNIRKKMPLLFFGLNSLRVGDANGLCSHPTGMLSLVVRISVKEFNT
ncbi:unnamed protein product, partial [marine sediment metagenome]